MKNAINHQDEYAAKVLGYNQKGRNYYSLMTRAHNSLHRSLVGLGFSHEQAEKMWQDAQDLVELARACGASTVQECICDDLNFAQGPEA